MIENIPLEDENAIPVIKTSNDGFLATVNKIRAKAKDNPPSLEEITKEVEIVRAKRYANR